MKKNIRNEMIGSYLFRQSQQIVKVLKAGFLLLLIPLPTHLPASLRSTTQT
jgi:hypothetical protein